MCLVKSNKCGYKCKIGLCYWKLVRCRWTIWALPRASVNSKSCINTCGINNLSYTRFWAMFLGRLYQVLQFFLLITFPYPYFSQEADHSCLLASLSCFLSFVDRIVNNYLHDRLRTDTIHFWPVPIFNYTLCLDFNLPHPSGPENLCSNIESIYIPSSSETKCGCKSLISLQHNLVHSSHTSRLQTQHTNQALNCVVSHGL